MTKTDFIKTEQARANVFNIFTALFCQPHKGLVKNKKFFDALQSALAIAYPEGVQSVDTMKKTIGKYSLLDLTIEYSRLFVGPFKLVAPPYSSVYFGDEFHLMSDETLWVMDFYRKMGLVYDIKLKNPPDHIAIETEFMYYLIFLEMDALRMKNIKKAMSIWKNQSVFFEKHFKKWVPVFCKKIEDGSENEFYKSLANGLKKFVERSTITEFPINTKKK